MKIDMGMENKTEQDGRILDAELAHERALEEDRGYDVATELGVRDQAGETIMAHGQRYSVAEALVQCKPFADMVKAVADNVPEEMRSTVVRGTIESLSKQAQNVPDEVSRRDSQVTQSNNAVKKN